VAEPLRLTVAMNARHLGIGILAGLLAAPLAAQTSGFDIQSKPAAPAHRRAIQIGSPTVYPLNHIFASHFYYTDAQVQEFAVELRVSAWPAEAKPWLDTEWRHRVGLSDAATFPVHVWRKRGDYVCAVQTFTVPMYPGADYKLAVDATRFRAGDWLYVEPSDAFTISSYQRDGAVTAAEWTLVTSVKTNAAYNWRESRPSPPWGNAAPFVDCTKPLEQ
jgi:hypothetical protein